MSFLTFWHSIDTVFYNCHNYYSFYAHCLPRANKNNISSSSATVSREIESSNSSSKKAPPTTEKTDQATHKKILLLQQKSSTSVTPTTRRSYNSYLTESQVKQKPTPVTKLNKKNNKTPIDTNEITETKKQTSSTTTTTPTTTTTFRPTLQKQTSFSASRSNSFNSALKMNVNS